MGRSVTKILAVCIAMSGMQPVLAAQSGIQWTRDAGTLTGKSPAGVLYVVRSEQSGFVLEGEKGDYRQTFGNFTDQFSALVDLRSHLADYDRQMLAGANLSEPQAVTVLPDRVRSLPAVAAAGSAHNNATEQVGPVALVPAVTPSAIGQPMSAQATTAPLPVKNVSPAPVMVDMKEAPAVRPAEADATPLQATGPVKPAADPVDEVREWRVVSGKTLEEVLREAAARVDYRLTYESKPIPIEADGTITASFIDFVDLLLSGIDIKPLPDVDIRKGNRWIIVQGGGM